MSRSFSDTIKYNTELEALEGCVRVWTELARRCCSKYEVEEASNIKNECPACSYGFRKGHKIRCNETCIVKWEAYNCIESPAYSGWVMANGVGNVSSRKYFAKQVLQLSKNSLKKHLEELLEIECNDESIKMVRHQAIQEFNLHFPKESL